MTKRPNPFGDYTPVQLKTCVTSCYMLSEEDKADLRRKTLLKLQQGSRELFRTKESSCNCLSVDNAKLNFSLERLRVPDTFNFKMMSKCSKGKEKCRGKCSTCTSSLAADNIRTCSHCISTVCVSCAQMCENCESLFCSLCSMANYDQPDVRYFCFSCL